MMTGVSNVGDATMVEVFGSSLAYLWECLGLLDAVKSELRRRVPVVTMTGIRCFVRWSSSAPTLHQSRMRCSVRRLSFVALCQSRSCVVLVVGD